MFQIEMYPNYFAKPLTSTSLEVRLLSAMSRVALPGEDPSSYRTSRVPMAMFAHIHESWYPHSADWDAIILLWFSSDYAI